VRTESTGVGEDEGRSVPRESAVWNRRVPWINRRIGGRSATIRIDGRLKGLTMVGKFGVAFSIVAASLVFAPVAVAMPPAECAQMCAGRANHSQCFAECLRR
jgi:hypothetical protein